MGNTLKRYDNAVSEFYKKLRDVLLSIGEQFYAPKSAITNFFNICDFWNGSRTYPYGRIRTAEKIENRTAEFWPYGWKYFDHLAKKYVPSISKK